MAVPRQLVAVVDDDRSMCRAISRLLLAGGFQSKTYSSGEIFLASHAECRPSCLVLDLHLPGLSGFEVRQRLLESAPNVPVIFITAHDAEETRERANESAAVAYLRKPFPGRELLDAIAKALKQGETPDVEEE